ncbi:MAG: BON domain-containing protein, partial [Acidobacteriaceae bacterium]
MIGKLRLSMFGLPLMAAAVTVFVTTGCSKKPTDAALATEVQKKIMADSALTAQPISVAVNNGTVTLSGTVGDQNMRDAAAKDASQVSDVRTVVNNLNVAPGANANEAPANNEGAQGGSASAPPPPANGQASAAQP